MGDTFEDVPTTRVFWPEAVAACAVAIGFLAAGLVLGMHDAAGQVQRPTYLDEFPSNSAAGAAFFGGASALTLGILAMANRRRARAAAGLALVGILLGSALLASTLWMFGIGFGGGIPTEEVKAHYLGEETCADPHVAWKLVSMKTDAGRTTVTLRLQSLEPAWTLEGAGYVAGPLRVKTASEGWDLEGDWSLLAGQSSTFRFEGPAIPAAGWRSVQLQYDVQAEGRHVMPVQVSSCDVSALRPSEVPP